MSQRAKARWSKSSRVSSELQTILLLRLLAVDQRDLVSVCSYSLLVLLRSQRKRCCRAIERSVSHRGRMAGQARTELRMYYRRRIETSLEKGRLESSSRARVETTRCTGAINIQSTVMTRLQTYKYISLLFEYRKQICRQRDLSLVSYITYTDEGYM